MNEKGWLGYTTASNPRKKDSISMSSLIGHRFMTLDSAWVQLMDIKRASVWRVWL
jgi:hypothetical protein